MGSKGTRLRGDLTAGVTPTEEWFRCEPGDSLELQLESEVIKNRQSNTEQVDRKRETADNSCSQGQSEGELTGAEMKRSSGGKLGE